MAKVRSLHGTEPAEIFESGLENVESINAVALSVLWNGGTVTTGWSNISPEYLTFMIVALDEKLRSENFRAPDWSTGNRVDIAWSRIGK